MARASAWMKWRVPSAYRSSAMTPLASRLLPWAAAAIASVAAGYCVVEATRAFEERRHREALATEADRRAVEIMAATLNGNVMGSVAALGLLNPLVKQVARSKAAAEQTEVMEALRAVGESYRANGVFVAGSDGIVRTSWYTIGRTLTGVDVRFRPYFQ